MNLTRLLIPLFVLCTHILSAQNFREVQANSIDIYSGVDLGYRLINKQPLVSNEDTNNRSSESINYSYRVGVNYTFGLSSRFALKTGVVFFNPGYSISKIKRIDFSEGINNIQKEYELEGYRYRVQHNFIGIPLGIKYSLSKGICDPYIEFGVIPSYYLNTEVIEIDIEGNTNKLKYNEEINRINLTSFFKVGGTFIIAEKLSGFIQLNANYQINNLRKEFPPEKLVTLGIEVGLRRYF